ncbi:hypothetical protein OIU85_010756 [Salix viminalis]|uniref:DUF4283 domain-containing protein n=1 Tax=Salix viminalis TaxID=40686 RepID=A0A9Q0SEW8_SALVM|nr:hypothetical protein OIU85_010756 [Salix viminalis]
MSPEPKINPCPPSTKSTKQPKTTRHHHIDSKFKLAAITSQEPRTTNNLFTDNLCANTAPKDTTDNPSFTKTPPETTATLTDNMQTISKKEIPLAPSKLPPACTTPEPQHAAKHHQPQPPTNALTTRPQATWADRVRVTDASTRFKLQNLDKQPSGSRLVIAQESLPETTEQWTRSMVGFFPGYKMPFHAAKSIARRAWEGYGLEQVMTMDAWFLIFRFKQESDMQEVLAKGPWMFGGKHIALQQWHPRIQFEKNKIKSIPVWIRLYGLPFPLWTMEGLSRAASMVGKPLSCDAPTYNSTRLYYVRVCVEVTADEDFIHQFELQTPLSTMPTTKNSDNQNPQHKPEAKQTLEQEPLNMDKQPTTHEDPPNQEHHPPNPIAETTHPQPVTATSQQHPPSKKQNAHERAQVKSQALDRTHLPPKYQESQLNPQINPPKPNSTENQKMDQQQSNQPTSHTQETAQRKGKGREMADTSNEITKESNMDSGHSKTLTANARE